MPVSFDLTGKTALVTGASSGLGEQFAMTLGDAGARVVLVARRADALSALAGRLKGAGMQAEVLQLDVADPAAITAAADHIGSVDVLINNAGVVRDRAALEQDAADWDAVMNVNLRGMFLMAQATARGMKARGVGGAIVNIASILGIRQAGGVLPYAVSKAGVIQMTKTLALEWARHGIRVNAIAPGYINTELNADLWQSEAGKAMIRRTPQRRLGSRADLDGPLLLLSSDAGAFMTGSVVVADGGHLVSTL